MKYDSLSKSFIDRIEYDRTYGKMPRVGTTDAMAVRRNPDHDKPSAWRGAFVRDVDKILHSAYYNRFTDKTQVFSFFRNDDISRRSFHVQLVSRIARTIGASLGLNLDLIEAIALGHDIGHTPFGHAGEKYLDELCFAGCGKHFSHNIHSVRVLDSIYPYNISLQTLNGIAAHNGEIECECYKPVPMTDFATLDVMLEECYNDARFASKIMPCTLEGCVVRICDIIAYLGKDRQDAVKAGLMKKEEETFDYGPIGIMNAEIINNLSVNIIENSYGKDFIKMSPDYFDSLIKAKRANYEKIYLSDEVKIPQDQVIRPIFEKVYKRLKDDLESGDAASPIFVHHINPITSSYYSTKRRAPYEKEPSDVIVTDYIASMTDDYFVELYAYLFPDAEGIKYHGYFENM